MAKDGCTHHWTVTSECPRCLRQQLDAALAEVARLQAAHDHQYNMAGLMLREAERAGKEHDNAHALMQKLMNP